jgi:aspartate/methionine/tyrosine aminotransferase
MFSKRVATFEGIPNRLYLRKEARLRAGKPIIDLISANVHLHGIQYPKAILKAAVRAATDAAKSYRPDPQGQRVARIAIEKYYQGEGIALPADQIVLTPGASIAYQYLLQLFANAGDEILCPSPSYPLFEPIAALTDIKIRYYRLTASDRWKILFDDFEKKITAKTRAIVVISPHNPTGAVLTDSEIARLSEIARRFALPIIFDEVFSPFLFKDSKLHRPDPAIAPLVVLINGVSKMLALPGMKMGWIGLLGDSNYVKKSVRMLQNISDTFLPVNEWAQFALPTLLTQGADFLKDYQAQIKRRWETAVAILSRASGVSFVAPEGGFYITVKINDPRKNEEKIALTLLEKEGILIHPGYFYDLPPGHLVICFVSPPPALEKNLGKIVGHL